MSTHRAVRKPKPRVHCIQCYDARIGSSQEEFLEKHFGVVSDNGKGKVVTLPGGFAFSTASTKEFEIALAVLHFTLEEFKTIKRVVILGHSNCGWFKKKGIAGQELAKLLAFTRLAREEVRRSFPHRRIKVEAFFAEFTSRKQKKAAFKKAALKMAA